MIFFGAVFLFSSAVSGQKEKNKNAVVLKGRLLNYGTTADLEYFSEIQHLIPKSYNHTITINPDSTFELEFSLKKADYFRLGRTKLYLRPGDNLDMELDQSDSRLSVFRGKGSEINEYLKDVAFPKSGSYLESGKNIRQTPAEMLEFIRAKYREREQQLKRLKNAPDGFVKLERARNRADVIKTFKSLRSYAGFRFRDKDKSFLDNYVSEFEKLSTAWKDSLLKNFIDPGYLSIEVYRDIVYDLDLSSAKPAMARGILDWKKAYELAYLKIKPENNKSILPGYRASIDSIESPYYREILEVLLADKMKFGNGDEAIDLVFRQPNGETARLSSLKGKVIYLDLWATWCGPCMAEMPHFEELKKKYSSNPDIALVSLSIDDNDAVWIRNLNERKPDGIQWRIDRPKLVDYGVESVPRYILIDRDFRVADMNAPRASDPALSSRIDKLVAGK